MAQKMPKDKKIILFGAGTVGRRALNFFGPDKVHCFADNYKAGQILWGKPVISFGELAQIHHGFDIVLSMVGQLELMEAQCRGAGISCRSFTDLASHKNYKSNPAIQRFKNVHRGKRCFVIGNGPSLRADDLTTLHKYNEFSFGCNAISKIFAQTAWRPDCYVVSDPIFYKLEPDMLAKTEAKHKFFIELEDVLTEDTSETFELFQNGKGMISYFHAIPRGRIEDIPRFSPDMSRAVYLGGTVMYAMLQIAVYMGFSEIYLLGVDGGAFTQKNPDEYLSEQRHFYEEDRDLTVRQCSNRAYEKSEDVLPRVYNDYLSAERYARETGVAIYNATRGGTVETFKRVDFDSLF